jgi:hypothetical protein
VRAGISIFAQLSPAAIDDGLGRLRRDLASGEWERRNAQLLELEEVDAGYRLIVGPSRR